MIIRVEADELIDYVNFGEYLKSWPDKLVSFTVEHLVDDEYRCFVHDLFEYCCEKDKDGPDFREWVKT